MRGSIRNLLFAAAAAATPVLAGGCALHSEPPIVVPTRPINDPPRHPAYATDDPVSKALREPPPAPGSLSGAPNVAAPQPGAPAGPSPQGDTTGIKLAELTCVRQALATAKPWQQAEQDVAQKIDAPDLRKNLHEGLSVLAPRVARALIDYRGDVAVVTVAVYRETRNPATAPTTSPATGPTYQHAGIALAFEGFNTRLDGTFIPRVMADQPRTPDDGREPIDPTLALDPIATSYMLFRLTPAGLTAATVGHMELRHDLVEAVDKLPAPATRRAEADTAPVLPDNGVEQLVPVPAVGSRYDPGEPWARSTPYDPYYYGPGYYTGRSGYYDPYLDGLYGCNWGSGLFITSYGYNHHHGHGHHDHDNDHDNGNPPNGPGRPPVVTSSGRTRATVPWLRPPVVSPGTGSGTLARGTGNNVATGSESVLSLPAEVVPRDAAGRQRLGPAVDSSRVVSGPSAGRSSGSRSTGNASANNSGTARTASERVQSTTITPNGRSTTADGPGSAGSAAGRLAPASANPVPIAPSRGTGSAASPPVLGPQSDPGRSYDGPRAMPSRGGGGDSGGRSAPAPSRGGGSDPGGSRSSNGGGSSAGPSRGGGGGGDSGGSRSSSGGGSSAGSSRGGDSGGSSGGSRGSSSSSDGGGSRGSSSSSDGGGSRSSGGGSSSSGSGGSGSSGGGGRGR